MMNIVAVLFLSQALCLELISTNLGLQNVLFWSHILMITVLMSVMNYCFSLIFLTGFKNSDFWLRKQI